MIRCLCSHPAILRKENERLIQTLSYRARDAAVQDVALELLSFFK